MRVRDHFEEYRETVNRIEEIEIQLEPIKRKLFNAKSPNLSDIRVVPKNSLLVMIARKDILESKLTRLRQKEVELYQRHLQEINKVSNDQYRRILRLVYLDRAPYEKIAELFKSSVENIRVRKQRADNEFAKQNGLVL